MLLLVFVESLFVNASTLTLPWLTWVMFVFGAVTSTPCFRAHYLIDAGDSWRRMIQAFLNPQLPSKYVLPQPVGGLNRMRLGELSAS